MAIYIFLLLFLGQYIYSKASRFNSACVSWQSQLVWIFFSPFISYGGVHSTSATRKNGTLDSFILFYVRWKWRGLATSFGQSRGFTAACMVGKLAFSGFPPLWEDEKRQLLLYRRSHRRYNCVFQFSTALRGGKPAVAALPPLSSAVSTAISSFPPLWEEANWQLQLYRLSHRR